MIHTGLVSVTFRKLQPKQIVDLVSASGLDAIEWGGDVHVPPGDGARATEVRMLTEDAGLLVASYGSYYRVGVDDREAFAGNLESAVELGAPTIRVWAADAPSREASGTLWRRAAEDVARIAELASRVGISIAFEYHENTLTDSPRGFQRLRELSGRRDVECYWQPIGAGSVPERLRSLEEILPDLRNVHVYFHADGRYRPLSEGKAAWGSYFSPVMNDTADHFCMIEFVMADSEEQFLSDAAELRALLAAAGNDADDDRGSE